MNMVCPNCERFIADADECPFCGADDVTPRFIKRLRISALCLAVFGLAALSAVSFCKELPLVKAGWITPMMNYANVRVRGVVDEKPFVGDKKDAKQYISFNLRDSTGVIRVSAYGKTAGRIMSDGKIPVKDDLIEAKGRLRVGGDGKVTLMLDDVKR